MGSLVTTYCVWYEQLGGQIRQHGQMFISQSGWREKREKNDEPWGSCESVIKYVNNKNTVLLEEENNCR